MPNVSLEPSKDSVSLENITADVDNGILIYGRGSYSIDQQRYNFQFGGQTFWEIKKGRITGMLRDVAYQSRTPDFWGACDALGGQATYQLGGTFSDAKGEPTQLSAVSHGCPVARFRQINVLNTAVGRGGSSTDLRVCYRRRTSEEGSALPGLAFPGAFIRIVAPRDEMFRVQPSGCPHFWQAKA